MEIEAGGVILYPDKGQQAAHLAVEIVDQLLVDDAVDAAGVNPLEMGDQAEIVAIISANRRQIVGECRARPVILLEIGETGGERMAAGVDDLCIWQDQADQADIGPVAG